MSESEFYDLHEIMTHNALWNFVTGHRSAGKTFSFKDYAIRDYLKTGSMFIYLRRHDSELEDRFTFFDDIKFKYPNCEFKVHGYNAYLRKQSEDEKKPNRWELFGFFRNLSTHQNRKGGVYARVNKICYDEFIIEDETHNHYLKNEVSAMLSFWHTVDRKRFNTRVFFFSNAASIVNPFYLTYKISVKDFKSKAFVHRAQNFVCVQYYYNETAQAALADSPLAALSAPTDYAAYAIDNQFIDDSDEFIRQVPKGSKYHYCLKFENEYFSVYLDPVDYYYYIDGRKPKKKKNIYCLTRSDMTPNIIMLERTSVLIKTLVRMFMLGNVWFDSPKTRGLFYEMSAMLNLR